MGELVVTDEPHDRLLLGRLLPDTPEARVLRGLGMARATPALAAPSCSGVLVVGATQIGKTTSMLIPAVRRWAGPVIATSIRDDVLRNSWRTREQSGWPVLVYNPTNIGGYGSNTWSPLVASMGDRPWAGARRMARSLVSAAELVDSGANAKQDFWNATAADYLAPLLLAASTCGPSMAPVIRWLRVGGLNDEDGDEGSRMKQEVRTMLAAHPDALRAAESVWGVQFRLRDSIYATARTTVSVYEDEQVVETCGAAGEMPEITPDALLGAEGSDTEPSRPGATLYILSPAYDWQYFAPVFAALVTSLIDAAYKRAGERGPLDPPLLLALDEVANITPISSLPKYSSTAAGEGIQLLTVLQDLGQAEQLWGETGTRTLLTNHSGGRLIFGGTVDPHTLGWVKEMLGEVNRERTSHSQEGFFGRHSRTRSWEREPLATGAEIRTMPKGTALLISGSAPPARVSLRPWTTI
jgi:type IV secretion system protein VirD4